MTSKKVKAMVYCMLECPCCKHVMHFNDRDGIQKYECENKLCKNPQKYKPLYKELEIIEEETEKVDETTEEEFDRKHILPRIKLLDSNLTECYLKRDLAAIQKELQKDKYNKILHSHDRLKGRDYQQEFKKEDAKIELYLYQLQEYQKDCAFDIRKEIVNDIEIRKFEKE